MKSTCSLSSLFLPAALVLLSACAGCGAAKFQPVHGKVTLEDGTPLTGGLVLLEEKVAENAKTSRGMIQSDGSFQLSTRGPGDGAPIGKYSVAVIPHSGPREPNSPALVAFDRRYGEFE